LRVVITSNILKVINRETYSKLQEGRRKEEKGVNDRRESTTRTKRVLEMR
jgi:hypothetical protein